MPSTGGSRTALRRASATTHPVFDTFDQLDVQRGQDDAVSLCSTFTRREHRRECEQVRSDLVTPFVQHVQQRGGNRIGSHSRRIHTGSFEALQRHAQAALRHVVAHVAQQFHLPHGGAEFARKTALVFGKRAIAGARLRCQCLQGARCTEAIRVELTAAGERHARKIDVRGDQALM